MATYTLWVKLEMVKKAIVMYRHSKYNRLQTVQLSEKLIEKSIMSFYR